MSDKLIDKIINSEFSDTKEMMLDVIAKKIYNRIEEKKDKIKNSFNGIYEDEDNDESEDDECSDVGKKIKSKGKGPLDRFRKYDEDDDESEDDEDEED